MDKICNLGLTWKEKPSSCLDCNKQLVNGGQCPKQLATVCLESQTKSHKTMSRELSGKTPVIKLEQRSGQAHASVINSKQTGKLLIRPRGENVRNRYATKSQVGNISFEIKPLGFHLRRLSA
ncbi:hypothetical protein AMECASPLE_036973 [Ameca splendens]|uniref:Uncharacterized protein n=1 Tax=Ameca splendens TaxID=208324 RepID=A0ABV0YIY1_9TELE